MEIRIRHITSQLQISFKWNLLISKHTSETEIWTRDCVAIGFVVFTLVHINAFYLDNILASFSLLMFKLCNDHMVSNNGVFICRITFSDNNSVFTCCIVQSVHGQKSICDWFVRVQILVNL